VTDKRHVSAAHSVRKESLVTLGWQVRRGHRRSRCVRRKEVRSCRKSNFKQPFVQLLSSPRYWLPHLVRV